MSSCTIFLDFDGVTHPDRCFDLDFFCRLPLIEDVLREFPAAMVVISSSWRDHYSLANMSDFFSSDIGPRLIDTTRNQKILSSTWLPDQIGKYERQFECELWMKENRRWGDLWMAIDDRPYWFEPECANLLVTDPTTGFQPTNQTTLRQMLKERT